MTSPTVTVILTVLNDPRAVRTLESVVKQTLPPLEILVADGGSTDETIRGIEEMAQAHSSIRLKKFPGTIAESRNRALAEAKGELVAFIDADEVAPEGWLEALVDPFHQAKVGFTAGPTPALPGTRSTIGAAYYDAYLNRFYATVAKEHPHALPMGNSAWRQSLFQEVGILDTTLYPKASSEDQEFALRVLAAGWEGVYVPGAWVHHDYSGLTLGKMLAKQATYATGGYVVWRRKGSTYEASGPSLAPYLVPPVLAVLGLLLLLVGPLGREMGEFLLALSVLSFGVLFLSLLVEGIVGEKTYPGWRFRPVEILRRWATLYGAARGFLQYGLKGARRKSPSSDP